MHVNTMCDVQQNDDISNITSKNVYLKFTVFKLHLLVINVDNREYNDIMTICFHSNTINYIELLSSPIARK